MLALSDALSLRIRRLSLTRSSELKGEEDKMVKSSGEMIKTWRGPITHSVRQENQVKNFLRKLRKNVTISESIYDNLFPSASRPGILYGIPKVHKFGVPLRPILSPIGTHSYGLAKFLVPLLRPISVGTHMVSDSFSFIQDLFALDVKSDTLTMASFDIKSLFTNISLDETIDIIVSNNSTYFQNFTRNEFTKLLSFAVKNCHFFFNGVMFEQTDDVAISSPLGPIFADIFLSWHERSWLSDCITHFKPVYYRRCVDDCFLLFASPDHIAPFLNYLNSQHPNINFTQETKVNNCLPFLDILITRANGSFSTSVFHKPTFTGLYNSFIPSIYKTGLISSLLNRYFSICYEDRCRDLGHEFCIYNGGYASEVMSLLSKYLEFKLDLMKWSLYMMITSEDYLWSLYNNYLPKATWILFNNSHWA